jgi:hypothetical protein
MKRRRVTGAARHVRRRAEISRCGRYRYLLEHLWADVPLLAPRAKMLVVCMLNPSKADAQQDDATVRWLTGWALKRDYTAMRVVNLAAFRATSPKVMLAATDPHGPENAAYLIRYCAGKDVLCGWGAVGAQLPQYDAMLDALHTANLKCVASTKTGAPGHPGRLSHQLELRDWPWESS